MGANTPAPKQFSPRGPLASSQGVGIITGGSSAAGSAAANPLNTTPPPAPAPAPAPAPTTPTTRTGPMFGYLPKENPYMELYGNRRTGDVYKRVKLTNMI